MRAGGATAARRLTAASAIAAASLLLAAAGASAATINVSITGDAPNGSLDDVGCTLRDAVQSANLNQTIPNGCSGDTAGADTIVLQGGKSYVLHTHGIDDTNAAGDLDISGPLTIRSSGPGLARIDAVSNTAPGAPVGADRAIHVLGSAGDVTLEGIRVEGGLVQIASAGEFGGGGGVLTESLLTLLETEVVGNRVEGPQVAGGGVRARGPNARLRIRDSTIAENVIVAGGVQALGAGVAAYPDVTELTIENSTISGNQGLGYARAGGVFGGDYLNSPAATLTNVTVAGNSAENIGGVWLRGSITGSLIAGNTVTAGEVTHPDCYESGTITSGGGNLIGNTGPGESCSAAGPGNLFGTPDAPIDPNLGTLVDNGGPTRTRVLNPGSLAIDRGGPCPATDQRGLFRAAAAPCDSGAVEVGASVDPPTPPVLDPPTPPVLDQPTPPASTPALVPPPAPPAASGPTGRRAAALARCGKLKKATQKQTRKVRQRCRVNARKQPL